MLECSESAHDAHSSYLLNKINIVLMKFCVEPNNVRNKKQTVLFPDTGSIGIKFVFDPHSITLKMFNNYNMYGFLCFKN